MSHLARIRFDRNELSGAFGDFGTDFPLLAGMILVAGLDSTGVLVVFGAMQIMTGLVYGLPMPVQPLKAMAAIVITQKLSAGVLFGGGLAIGILMLALTVLGLLDGVARVVPKTVVRGIQFGLGLQLAGIALGAYVPGQGRAGYLLAALAFLITLFLLGNRRFPPAPFVILLGVGFAFFFGLDFAALKAGFGFSLPSFRVPTQADVLTGLLLLALPQLPLSLGNSLLATRQVVSDFFPERRLGLRRIGLTYSLMNLVSPFFGGVPTCHGSGGIAGHYAFGARTGGSVVLYGLFYLVLGLFFSSGFQSVLLLFPRPILGVILLFEALALIRLISDEASSKARFAVVLLVGLLCASLPYGYVVGLVVGALLSPLLARLPLAR